MFTNETQELSIYEATITLQQKKRTICDTKTN
jgi:hypothetical protein